LVRAIAPVLCHLAEDIWQYLPYKTPYLSVFEAGWVHLDPAWERPDLAVKWARLRQIRAEVNKVMETARNARAIGSSLEAKVLLYAPPGEVRQQLEAFLPVEGSTGNRIDELRYLFLASQVELVDSLGSLETARFRGESDLVAVAIVGADGQKCDRCWHYSPLVGTFPEDPTLCERCHEALAGAF
jgi:isoleucyl-tRNA synthetase